jgi:hypothetical protein
MQLLPILEQLSDKHKQQLTVEQTAIHNSSSKSLQMPGLCA